MAMSWEEFKSGYNKSYASESEEQARKAVYEQNLVFIREHDAVAAGFTVAVNQFADLTAAEFGRLVSKRAHVEAPIYEGPALTATDTDFPPSMDWRSTGCVGPVQNQGQCGAVWAIVSRNLIQTYNCLKHGHRLIALSLQDLLDCTPGSEGCSGGFIGGALQYCTQRGLDTEATYPYTGRQGTCRHNASTVGAKCTQWHRVTPPGNETALTQVLAYTGPVISAIDASQSSFQLYSGGVYSDPACSPATLDHAVLTVGYGVASGQPYYILQNSWGAAWGMNGYMLMARNKHNMCGIASDAYWVTVA